MLAANRPSDKTALYLRTIRSIVPLHYAGTVEWILFTLRLLLMLVCCFSSLFIAATELQTKMNEAEDYLTVNPAHSLSLLDAIGPITAPAEDALRWHILSMRAAVPTNQLERILTSLDVIFNYQQHPAFAQYLTSISSAAAIWLRRNDYLQDARLSLNCAQKYASDTRQNITLMNSMGLVNRQLDDYEQARQHFNQALSLATATEQTKVMAMVENNLGLLALDEGDLTQAVAHLRLALTHYQTLSQRSGQISAGLNLLLAFILQQDLQNFQRLYTPTANLTLAFPNEAKQALLLWLQLRQQQLLGQAISADDIKALQLAYTQLEDSKTQQLIYTQLAPALQVKLKAPVVVLRQGFSRPWFALIKQCNWPLVQTQLPATANQLQ